MMMKKENFFVLTLLLLTFISAGSVVAEIDIGKAVSQILDIGSLKFLFGASADNQLIGFVRIVVAILVFALLYLGSSMIPHMSKNIAITISILLSIITAVFLPKEVLLVFGETYATIFALIIIGGPIIAIMALCFFTPTPNRAVAFIKFLTVCFVMWLIAKISVWAGKLGSATGRVI